MVKIATVDSRIPELYTVPFMFCVNLRFISTEIQENCNLTLACKTANTPVKRNFKKELKKIEF